MNLKNIFMILEVSSNSRNQKYTLKLLVQCQCSIHEYKQMNLKECTSMNLELFPQTAL